MAYKAKDASKATQSLSAAFGMRVQDKEVFLGAIDRGHDGKGTEKELRFFLAQHDGRPYVKLSLVVKSPYSKGIFVSTSQRLSLRFSELDEVIETLARARQEAGAHHQAEAIGGDDA